MKLTTAAGLAGGVITVAVIASGSATAADGLAAIVITASVVITLAVAGLAAGLVYRVTRPRHRTVRHAYVDLTTAVYRLAPPPAGITTGPRSITTGQPDGCTDPRD